MAEQSPECRQIGAPIGFAAPQELEHLSDLRASEEVLLVIEEPLDEVPVRAHKGPRERIVEERLMEETDVVVLDVHDAFGRQHVERLAVLVEHKTWRDERFAPAQFIGQVTNGIRPDAQVPVQPLGYGGCLVLPERIVEISGAREFDVLGVGRLQQKVQV